MPEYLCDYKFIDILARGWGISLGCLDCKRQVHLSDKTLFERFGDRLDQEVRTIAPKLVCSAPEGCGSRNIVASYRNSGALDLGIDDALFAAEKGSELIKAKEAALRAAAKAGATSALQQAQSGHQGRGL